MLFCGEGFFLAVARKLTIFQAMTPGIHAKRRGDANKIKGLRKRKPFFFVRFQEPLLP
jgi:hypothetical protein